MQILSEKIIKNYNKYVGKGIIRKKVRKDNKKFLTREIIEKLKQSEKEIANRRVIPAEVVFKDLRNKYGYKEI